MISYLALGFVVGIRHALEADHLAAVASLATRGGSLRRQAAQGALWGLGHTLTLLVVSGLCVALGLVIPQGLERGLEGLVGVMLVVLGASVLVRMRRQGLHIHGHRHADGTVHVHAHRHPPGITSAQVVHDHAHVPLQAVLVGSVHGLAGSAALALLVAQTARTLGTSLLYIAVFGLGSIVGMMALATAIGVPLGASARRRGRLFLLLCGSAGGFSVLLGGKLLWIFASGG